MNERRPAAAVIVAVLIGAATVAVMPQVSLGGSGFRDWLAEVADERDADRGWHLVADWVREDSYGGDVDAYLADVMAADWDALRLEAPVDTWSDDGFTRVTANLLSAPETVPQFLLDRNVVHGECTTGGRPVGIGAYEDRRPLGADGFAAGGMTGSQTLCNAAFAGGS